MSNKDLASGRSIKIGEYNVVVKPLTLKQLRKFVKIVKLLDAEAEEMTDEDISNMVEAASIALEKASPELAADKEELEEILDIKTFNAVLEAAMGTDPEE